MATHCTLWSEWSQLSTIRINVHLESNKICTDGLTTTKTSHFQNKLDCMLLGGQFMNWGSSSSLRNEMLFFLKVPAAATAWRSKPIMENQASRAGKWRTLQNKRNSSTNCLTELIEPIFAQRFVEFFLPFEADLEVTRLRLTTTCHCSVRFLHLLRKFATTGLNGGDRTSGLQEVMVMVCHASIRNASWRLVSEKFQKIIWFSSVMPQQNPYWLQITLNSTVCKVKRNGHERLEPTNPNAHTQL